jgi:hypothetical protein
MSRVTCIVAAMITTLGLSASARAQEPGDDSLGITADAKLGPAFGIGALSGYGAFALELEGGYALIGRQGYVTFSPNFLFGNGATIVTLPAGFRYEFELPVDGLSAYGRATLGVGFGSNGGDPGFHFGPHAGAKYKITDMIHVGLEPFSLPLYFGKGGTAVVYRILAFGGVDL